MVSSLPHYGGKCSGFSHKIHLLIFFPSLDLTFFTPDEAFFVPFTACDELFFPKYLARSHFHTKSC